MSRPANDGGVVLLERNTAEELLDLVEDRPGDADEDLLDDALAAISAPSDRLSSREQMKIAQGQAVAVSLDGTELAVVGTLIRQDEERDPSRLQRIGSALKAKLAAARKKENRRSGGRRR